MALRRRTGSRFEANAWAGFVDAMTALLMVMIFILSVFMIMQFFLRETIGRQAGELDSLSAQISSLADVLGATREERDNLQAEASQKDDEIGQLRFDLQQRSNEISSFEAQIASLLARNTQLSSTNENLTSENATLNQKLGELESIGVQTAQQLSDLEKLELALVAARSELDAEKETARKAAAQADALQSMIDQLRSGVSDQSAGLDGEIRASIAQVMALASISGADQPEDNRPEVQALREQVENLTALEREQVADQIALDFLRKKLRNADDELNAMTLSLEEERRKAEETLTILAAIDKQREDLATENITEAERNAALLEIAQKEIAAREEVNAEAARKIALLNQQTADLRAQLSALNELLDTQIAGDKDSELEIASLGQKLNVALAKVAATQKNRADDLEFYRSDFFGKLREVLANVEGVEIVGDRFVFSSEVLFPSGGASLSEEGFLQIGQIATLINNLSSEIPSNIDWILRVDGHTDNRPIAAGGRYKDNWELSQARALSVVKLMVDLYGVDPSRLAAAGFGEFHPIDTGNSEAALARNRRIELKLTEQ